jgi:sugar lactone lactonase YvrE
MSICRSNTTGPALLVLSLLACTDADDDPADPGDAGDAGGSAPAELVLPGDDFFPESIAASEDGTLYVSSLGTGAIVAFPPGASESTVLFAPGTEGVTSVAGILVDDDAGVLWACAGDIAGAVPFRLLELSLADGSIVAAHGMPAGPPGICNDLVRVADGTLYATDSVVGRILRLPAGGDDLEVWSAAPVFAPTLDDFSINGIAWDGDASLFVSLIDTGALYRVPIAADGTAGEPVQIDTPPFRGPDALRAVDGGRLRIVEAEATDLIEIEIEGDVGVQTVLSSQLVEPSSFVEVDGDVWVSEGQVGRFFEGVRPDLPFLIRRLRLP